MDKSFPDLRKEQMRENIARKIEEDTTDRLLEAATELYADESPTDTVITAIHELESAGFRHSDDDGNVELVAFAGVEFYQHLEDSVDSWRHEGEDINTVEVYDIVFHSSPTLPGSSLLLIHDKALAPSLGGADMVPFLIRHEDGIVVAKE